MDDRTCDDCGKPLQDWEGMPFDPTTPQRCDRCQEGRDYAAQRQAQLDREEAQRRAEAERTLAGPTLADLLPSCPAGVCRWN